jgi:hypothetical protein
MRDNRKAGENPAGRSLPMVFAPVLAPLWGWLARDRPQRGRRADRERRQQRAVDRLLRSRNSSAERILERIICGDIQTYPIWKYAASELLKQTDRKEFAARILTRLAHTPDTCMQDTWRRFFAIDGLCDIRHPVAAAALHTVLRGPDESLSRKVAESLIAYGGNPDALCEWAAALTPERIAKTGAIVWGRVYTKVSIWLVERVNDHSIALNPVLDAFRHGPFPAFSILGLLAAAARDPARTPAEIERILAAFESADALSGGRADLGPLAAVVTPDGRRLLGRVLTARCGCELREVLRQYRDDLSRPEPLPLKPETFDPRCSHVIAALSELREAHLIADVAAILVATTQGAFPKTKAACIAFLLALENAKDVEQPSLEALATMPDESVRLPETVSLYMEYVPGIGDVTRSETSSGFGTISRKDIRDFALRELARRQAAPG